MTVLHKCVVCIGSNYNRSANLLLAREKLLELFASVRFSLEQEMLPLHIQNPALFSNQVAVFTTEWEQTRVQRALKEIEGLSGRSPQDKQEEKVCLDIDLLAYDRQILKPEDWQREYVQEELSMIH